MSSALSSLYVGGLLTTMSTDLAYVSLYTAEPDETLPTTNESTAGRIPVTWALTGSRTIQNSSVLQWASVTPGTYSYVGLWAAASGSTASLFRGWLQLPAPITVPITTGLVLAASTLTIGFP
jgi:hypothetical protein